MRKRLAQGIVRLISKHIECAYLANCHGKTKWENYHGRNARWLQKALFPIAKRLDHDAMVEQMVNECWWG